MKKNTSVIKEILFLYYSYKRVKKTWTILKDLMEHIELRKPHQLRLEVHKPIVITKFFCLPLRSCLCHRGLWAQPPAGVQAQGRSSSRGLGGGAPRIFFCVKIAPRMHLRASKIAKSKQNHCPRDCLFLP